MVGEQRLAELLMQWQHLRQQGRSVDVEELCSESPELMEELQRRIEALAAPDTLLDVTARVDDSATTTGGPLTPDESAWPVIPGYEVLAKLGEGGMGVVYQVRNLGVGRVEALKMITARAAFLPQMLQRFQMEIRAMAELQHARIVRIYAAGQHDDQPYFTMEYVASGNLARQMGRFADTPESAAGLMVKVARAVHYLHTKNIVHRDLKPGNILLNQDDDPLVSDFGLAKLFDQQTAPAGPGRVGEFRADRADSDCADSDRADSDGSDCASTDGARPDLRLTQAGAVVGTPSYMSPEQAAGWTDKLTAASDVWAIGVMLYELLTGRRPFEGVDSDSVREAVRSAVPLRPRHYRPKLDQNLEAICLRCLQKAPAARYPDAEALAQDLERWQRGEPILPERWQQRLWRSARRHPASSAAAGLLIVFAAVLAVLWWRTPVVAPLDKTAAAEAQAEANLQTVLTDVESQRRATLIPELGPPRAYRWGTRDIHDSISAETDKPFSLHGDGYALLELVPAHTMSHYRLRLEVHHDEGQAGRVGVYLGYSKQTTAEGLPIHCFCGIDFNDIVAIPGRRADQAADLFVRLHLLYPKALGQAPNAVRLMGAGVSTSFRPAGSPRPEVWRSMQIDVDPDEVRVTFGEETLPPLRHDKMQFFARQIVANSPKQPQEPPRFSPREALGVYAFKASAWFRSCTIEARPTPPPN